MARRHRKQKRDARRNALQGAAAARMPPAEEAPPAPTERREQARPRWALLGAAAAALIGIAIFAALAWNDDVQPLDAGASSTIVVGVPGGQVTSPEASPSNPSATPQPTRSPTHEPVPSPAAVTTPAPTPVATAAPEPAAPPPATPAPATPSAPDPTPVIVAVAQPDDAVAAFYSNVASGNFDAAYGLWSDRMKATYPRQENLDDRFAQTASITFSQLFVATQSDGTATVQANFTETYDSGSSREFIGYWELIRVEGRWLLDAPHY